MTGELLTIRETAARLGIKPVTLRAWIATRGLPVHGLRHTANSLMAAEGVDESVRMSILGHTNVKIHQLYTHSSREQVEAALERLERRIREA